MNRSSQRTQQRDVAESTAASSRSGSALGIVMVVLLLFSLLGLALLKQSEANTIEVVKRRQSMQAFWAAEGGVARVKKLLVKDAAFRSTPGPVAGVLGGVDYAVSTVSTGGNVFVVTSVATNAVWRRSLQAQVAVTTGAAGPPTGGGQPLAMWSGTATPEYNFWDGSAFTGTSNAVTQAIRWRIMAGASSPTRDEKIVVGIESGGEISGEMWTGTGWDKTDLTSLDYVNDTFWWSADVAYESQSGDAVLVWNGGNTSGQALRYKVWNGTSWSAPAAIAAYAGGEPKQMQLVSNPRKDEMVVVVSDGSSHDHALVWNGSSWGNAITLHAGAGDDRTDVYAAYEQQSGYAMAVYSRNNADANYRVWNGTSWGPENTITKASGIGGKVRWTTLASDPGSDRIALGVLTFNAETWFAVWNGSSWGAGVASPSPSPGSIYPNLAVAFESSSGDVVAVRGQNDKKLLYRTWTSSGGWTSEVVGPDMGGTPNTIMLDADPDSDHMMLSAQDNGNDLNFTLWDGAAWANADELEKESAEVKNQPFIFLWGRGTVEGGLPTATLTAVKDTYIKGKPAEQGLNFGASSTLVIDRETTDLHRALLQFDLSGIPAGSTIDLAVLRLECTQMGGALSIGVYEMLEAWSEGAGDDTPDAANWNQRQVGTAWTTPGAYFNPVALDLLNGPGVGPHAFTITDLVRDWVSGAKPNYGVMVGSPDGGGNRTASYDSREGPVKPSLDLYFNGSVATILSWDEL
jgi:hypothetical protein